MSAQEAGGQGDGVEEDGGDAQEVGHEVEGRPHLNGVVEGEGAEDDDVVAEAHEHAEQRRAVVEVLPRVGARSPVRGHEVGPNVHPVHYTPTTNK